MKFTITNQKDLREEFWNTNTDLERHVGWKQNQYPTDTRCRWVEFVDHMYREGIITEALADRATL